MTPQSTLTVLAPIQTGRIGKMRALLASMNAGPGAFNPNNTMIPFAQFNSLHSARLAVLDDQTIGDPETFYGVERSDPPVYLAFLADFDGSYDAFISLLVQNAAPGLRQIFSLCEGFSQDTDLRAWMIAHENRPSAYYCNYVGRTVQQTREEQQLRLALRTYLDRSPEVANGSAREVHQSLRRYVQEETAQGRLTLTPSAPTPLGWRIGHMFAWITLSLLIIGFVVILPLTIIPLGILALVVRSREASDPEFAPRPEHRLETTLAALEDHDVTNQFTAMGSLKPGWLRALIAALVLRIINLASRTLYNKGRLTRIHTIHFARWVYMDKRTRVLFTSVYDGSLESYNEDFINKTSIGLNLIFGNGVGYPRTAWLVGKGAKDEQKFKYFLRRHELPTDVWYNAHAGLTAFDLLRNSVIRNGIEKTSLTEQEAREWVALI